MRKLFSLCCLLLLTGLALGGEVTLVRYDKESKELRVKEGDQEKTYKVTTKTKFSAVDKNGNTKEMRYSDAIKGLCSPAAEGKLKFEIRVQDGTITEAKLRARNQK
ncbi:MAG TPA: hypothetical protein VGE74_29835 [Gemmata sp.]